MAEVILRQRLARMSFTDGWELASAGMWAVGGIPAIEGAQKVMAERGMDLSGHQSSLLSAEMVDAFNLILVMEMDHKKALQEEFPALKNRVFLLSEMAGEKLDVDDPVGKPLEEYRRTADLITRFIDSGFDRIFHESLARS